MKFATKPIGHYPLHHRHVATLPWDIKNLNFLQIFIRYGRKCKQSCREFKGGNFFWDTVYIGDTYTLLLLRIFCFYSAPVGVRCIVLWSTCLSVCLSVCKHIFGTAGPKFCVLIPCGRGLLLLRRRYALLCTSGFMNDPTFGRNGRDAEWWAKD